VHGEQRVSTHELLTVRLGVPVTDRACRRLRRVMRELGWHGPRLMRWGKQTLKGYWRYPTVSLPAIVPEQPVAEVATAERETLAPELERVTLLGLQKLEQILRIPTDRGDGNLLRAQTAAAGLAVNAQLRADQARMKQVPRRDMMERIIAMVKEEEAKLAELRKGEDRAAAPRNIVGPSSCAEDLPAPDTTIAPNTRPKSVLCSKYVVGGFQPEVVFRLNYFFRRPLELSAQYLKKKAQ
jgi:hypothetical protein